MFLLPITPLRLSILIEIILEKSIPFAFIKYNKGYKEATVS